jgi:sec-independent protein translocase protein TatB
MLDIGWSEMAVIALVALVVIGPKDLPKVMRTVGQWVRKARSVSREFQSSIDEMIREAELDDAKKVIQSTRNFNVDRMLDETIDPTGELKKEVRAIEAEARDDGGKAPEKVPGKADSTAKEPAAGQGKAEAAPGATVIKHPAQPAPPHSLTLPKETSGNGAKPAAAEPAAPKAGPAPDVAAEQKPGQKSA